MTYFHSRHSVHALYYHLVLVVKYRKKVIDNEISLRLKDIFMKTAEKYNIELKE
ncbi:MAG: transposase [Christensenellaceae bacterium]|jgi:putative transposase|nr:transposase [Christensenellaceae bacterium]